MFLSTACKIKRNNNNNNYLQIEGEEYKKINNFLELKWKIQQKKSPCLRFINCSLSNVNKIARLNLFVCDNKHSVLYALTMLFIHSLTHSFIHSFIHLLVNSFAWFWKSLKDTEIAHWKNIDSTTTFLLTLT